MIKTRLIIALLVLTMTAPSAAADPHPYETAKSAAEDLAYFVRNDVPVAGDPAGLLIQEIIATIDHLTWNIVCIEASIEAVSSLYDPVGFAGMWVTELTTNKRATAFVAPTTSSPTAGLKTISVSLGVNSGCEPTNSAEHGAFIGFSLQKGFTQINEKDWAAWLKA